MSYNPFDEISERLKRIEQILSESKDNNCKHIEVIDQDELAKRLAVTKPTIITWEKRGKIPSLRLGASVRYNWPAVIESLENPKKKK